MYTFYGRRTELAELNSRFHGSRSEFFIIYGRRRVGKSELINEFIRQNTGLRIQVREGSRKYQLNQFAQAFSEFFHDPFISKNGFTNWDSIILFCEVKCQDNVDGKQIICDLKQKATHIKWKVNERKEFFLVIARSFSALSTEENEVCMDLAMIETLLSDRTLSIYQKTDNNAKNQCHK